MKQKVFIPMILIVFLSAGNYAFAQEKKKGSSFIFMPHFNMSGITMWNLPLKMSGPNGDIEIQRRKLNLKFWKDDYKFDYGDFYAGMKVVYVNPTSVIGGFAFLDYKNKGFDMKYPDAEEYTRHYTQAIAPALGLRVRTGKLTGFHWVFETGAAYNYNFKYNGSYNNSTAVVNNGITGIYGFGFEWITGRRNDYESGMSLDGMSWSSSQYATKDSYLSLTLQYHKDHYNFFNENFSPDGGITKPYQGFRSNIGYLCLTLTVRGSLQFNWERGL
jgi:hypothetical protein